MLNAIPISSGFSDFFKQHLPWHKAETDYLVGILTVMHVHPTLIPVGHKNTLPSQAKPAFSCRRMQRFVTHEWLVYLRFYRALIWPSEKQSVQSGRRAYGGTCEDERLVAVLTIGAANTRAAPKSHRLAARYLCRLANFCRTQTGRSATLFRPL